MKFFNLETWNVASRIIENDRGLILTYFMSRSNLLPNVFKLEYFLKVPPQIKKMNMVIPILIHYLTFFLQKDSANVLWCAYVQWLPAHQLHIFTCQPMKSDVT